MPNQQNDSRPKSFGELLSLTPMAFEWWCAAELERSGYGHVTVSPKGPKGGDGGVDLRICDDAGRVICLGQCKWWAMRPSNGLMHVIRELAGSMADFGVDRGLLMITVPVTAFELRKAFRLGIEVIDANGLRTMLQRVVERPLSKLPDPLVNVVATTPTRTISTKSTSIQRCSLAGFRSSIRPFVILAALLLLYVYWEFVIAIVGLFVLVALGTIAPARRRRRYRRRRFRS